MSDDQRQQRYWEGGLRWRLRPWDHPVVERFAGQRLAEIERLIDLDSVETALDVGCGDGASTMKMQRRVPEVWAVDRSEAMLERHPLRDSGRLRTGDVYALPFEDDRFDLVYAWEVLHHVERPQQAVAEMARVSRRWVLLAEPNPLNPAQLLFACIDREHRWVLHFRPAYLAGLVRGAGLEVVTAFSGGWILPNQTPGWLAPLLERLPYRFPLGITNWVLGRKPGAAGG